MNDQRTDTLPQWLFQRFGTDGRVWESLCLEDQEYWAHEAAAVRRAVERGGFKQGEICGQHRPPQGPNEDLAVCGSCGSLTYAMRPPNETYGLHLPDCSLPMGHESFCEPGGAGHPRAEVIRGYGRELDEEEDGHDCTEANG